MNAKMRDKPSTRPIFYLTVRPGYTVQAAADVANAIKAGYQPYIKPVGGLKVSDAMAIMDMATAILDASETENV